MTGAWRRSPHPGRCASGPLLRCCWLGSQASRRMGKSNNRPSWLFAVRRSSSLQERRWPKAGGEAAFRAAAAQGTSLPSKSPIRPIRHQGPNPPSQGSGPQGVPLAAPGWTAPPRPAPRIRPTSEFSLACGLKDRRIVARAIGIQSGVAGIKSVLNRYLRRSERYCPGPFRHVLGDRMGRPTEPSSRHPVRAIQIYFPALSRPGERPLPESERGSRRDGVGVELNPIRRMG